jgi:hypothetical protein
VENEITVPSGHGEDVVSVGETVITKALSVNDSIFLILLIGLAFGTWWIIRYVFTKNDEREKRYIDVIENQAKGLQSIDLLQADVKEIKQTLQRRE